MAQRLTSRNVLTLGPGEYRDPTLPRFILRVRPSGIRTFGLRYSVGNGLMARVVIGDAKTLTLEDARAVARTLLGRLWTGVTPRAAKAEAEARARTVGDLGSLFLESVTLSAAVSREWARRFKREVEPAPFGILPAVSVTPDDIDALLEPIVKRAPVSANRLFGFVRRVFSWAVERRLLATSPAEGMKRPFDGERPSERVLAQDEIFAMLRALDDMQDRASTRYRNGKRPRKDAGPTSAMGDATTILMLTGARERSIVGAEAGHFEDLDNENRRWVIPGRLMKAGRAFIVPLSRQAAAIVSRRIAETKGFRYLFPRMRVTRARRGPTMTWSSRWVDDLCQRMDAHLGRPAERWTVHNLRHTMATHMEEKLAIREKVVSMILAHVHGSAADRIYSRADLMAERREALQKYADWLDGVRRSGIKGVSGGSVGAVGA